MAKRKTTDVSPQPCLQTKRLLLRPFGMSDAAEVQRLAGDREVASTTLLIPHPYADGMAEDWTATHAEQFAIGQQAVFAIVRQADQQLLGAVGLSITVSPAHHHIGLDHFACSFQIGTCLLHIEPDGMDLVAGGFGQAFASRVADVRVAGDSQSGLGDHPGVAGPACNTDRLFSGITRLDDFPSCRLVVRPGDDDM